MIIKKIIVGSLFISFIALAIFYAVDYKLKTDTRLSEQSNTIAIQEETINEHVASLEELREQKIIVEEERDVALSNLALKNAEFDTLSEIRNQLLIDIESITSQKNSALAEIQTLTNSINGLNEEIAELQSELADEILANSQNQALIQSLQSDLVELQGLKTNLENALLQAQTDNAQLNIQIQTLTNSINGLNEEIAELQSELADEILANSQNQALIQSLQSDLVELQGLKTNLENALLQAQTDNAQLGLQIQTLNSDILILNGQILNLNNEINSLNLTVSTLQAQVQNLESQLANQEPETDYTTMQELFNIMLTVPKIDVDINELEMNTDYAYITYYSSYSQVMNTDYVFGGSLLAEIYYISSDFEIFGTSTYSMNGGFSCDDQNSSTDFLAVDYINFDGYVIVVYKDSSPDGTIYCYSQFNMNILNDYAMIEKDFDMLHLSFGQGDYIKIQVIGENIDYSIQIENEVDMYLTPDVLGLDTYNVFDFENVTFKVQYFYENGIACTNLYEV